jgi:hypothetical protein
MATDSFFLRMVGGNVANPTLVDPKVSAHDFMAALQLWVLSGEITKAEIIAKFDATAANDSDDLDAFNTWLSAANNQDGFLLVVESRLILAREKFNPELVSPHLDLDGLWGFAVKSIFVNGADDAHSLENTGPAGQQFNAWYPG